MKIVVGKYEISNPNWVELNMTIDGGLFIFLFKTKGNTVIPWGISDENGQRSDRFNAKELYNAMENQLSIILSGALFKYKNPHMFTYSTQSPLG